MQLCVSATFLQRALSIEIYSYLQAPYRHFINCWVLRREEIHMKIAYGRSLIYAEVALPLTIRLLTQSYQYYANK